MTDGVPLVLAVVRKVVLNGWGSQMLLHHRRRHPGSIQRHLAMCRASPEEGRRLVISQIRFSDRFLCCYLQCVIGCRSPVIVFVNARVELVQHLAVVDRAGLDGVRVLVVMVTLSRDVVSSQMIALSRDVVSSQAVRG